MQSSEEPRKGAGRPSLLTPAQQAEADRNRILTKLEHGKTEVPASSRKRGRAVLWGATGALALALAGGAAFNMGGDEPHAAQSAPVVLAAASVAPARAVNPAPAEVAVPAATIHDEPLPASNTAAKPAPDDLRKALEEGTAGKQAAVAKSEKPARDDLRDALEEGTAVKKAPAPKPAVRVVKAPAKPALKSAPAVRKAPAPTSHDSDVALLSALVAHSQPARVSESNRALKRELAQCRRMTGRKARDCREEACLGQDRGVAGCK